MKQKEYDIGEFFTIDNCTYKVVVDYSNSCRICDFENEPLCDSVKCIEFERADETGVSFILYDENTESTED